MSDIEAMVEKYVASWSVPDEETRRGIIAEIWAPDAVYKNPIAEFNGLQGIEDAVTEAYDMFATQGYTFRVAKVDSNHEAVRYTWEMTPAGATEPEVIGTQVVTLDEQGRMQRDFQFVDKAPAAMLEALGMPPLA
jgi:SnoaL-like domain